MPRLCMFKSKRLYIASTILWAIIFLKYSPYLIIIGVLLLSSFSYPMILKPLKNYKFWIIIFLLIIIVPILSGLQDRSFLGITYSSVRLSMTILMALRGILVFILFQVLTIDLNSEKVAVLFSKIGINHFDTIFTLSKEIMPRTKSIFQTRLSSFRNDWRNQYSLTVVLDFLSNIFADFIFLADEIIKPKRGKTKISPTEFLNNRIIKQKPALVIIAGDPSTGKTPWLKSLVKELTSANESVDGLIAEKVIEQEKHWSYQIKRLSTGENCPLNTMVPINTSIRAGRFFFYSESLVWGCEQIIISTAADWLIVDEVGLLEFEGKGFLPALQTVSDSFSGCVVMSMRTKLVNRIDKFLTSYLPDMQEWPHHIIWV